MSTWYLSFGSLRVGEKFRFLNQENSLLEKVSPRKYKVLIGEGNPNVTFSTSVNTAVLSVRI